MALHLGVALIQAYIFMLLTLIYVSQAVSHDH
jgi:F-type H+-transporting ATPase subunit a